MRFGPLNSQFFEIFDVILISFDGIAHIVSEKGCRAREDKQRGEKKDITSRERSTLVGALKARRDVYPSMDMWAVSDLRCAVGGWLRKYFHYK